MFSTGLVLACFVGMRLARQAIDQEIVRETSYLSIASTPVFELPPATPLPTLTPTPSPTATPLPLPPIRMSIPAINLNASIQDIYPSEKLLPNGEKTKVWEPLAYAIAHYATSSNPGGGRNIVFLGHNNTLGEVFRYLDQLNPGDEIILFTDMNEFRYQVTNKIIVPYRGAETEGDAILQSYSAPQSGEMVTLISCWPYATNANRIIIIAEPITPNAHGN